MSDEEFESFDVNDRDIEYALNPGRNRRQTKDDQIYGIWAEKDEEEQARPSFGKTKPLKFTNFVSGGISVGSKMDKQEEDEEDDEPTPSTSGIKNKDDYVEVSVFQTKKKTAFASAKGGGFAGTRSSEAAPSWTASSGKASVIMNMMKKMGYEHGKGLGSNKQGIVEPVVANVRKGRGAVGAYGAEQKGPKFGESAADAQKRSDDSVEIIEEEVVVGDTWKKTKKARVKYRTLNEVISDGSIESPAIVAPKMKIIDMTGPQERTYDDIHSYHRRKPLKESNKRPFFDVPALTENLNTLLSSCEQEILNTHSHLEELKKKNKIVENDQNKLKVDIKENEEEMRRLDEVIHLVKQFDHVEHGVEPLEHYKRLFYQLNAEYSAESKLFNIEAVIQFKVLPMITRFFSRWDPLDPEMNLYGYDEMLDWKKLLSMGNRGVLEENKHENRAIPTFDLLLWEGWMPQMRRAVLRWDARTNSPQMNSVLASWSSLLPPWMVDNMFDQLILPKIEEKVAEWNPVTDEIPLDEWLIPWNEMLGHRLLDVYSNVRQKMGIALRRWIPTDLS
uniref:G-patch domain-containing protein n=2 Tax=Bursaphelenchus xylophilus TaxID=6326 RepID=A0A1I7RQT8_BURXY